MSERVQSQRSRLGKNAVWTLVQAIVSGIILFLLYRFLLQRISTEDLGVWSLVSGLGIVARVGDVGFSGAVTQFVARYLSRADVDKVKVIIQTAVVSTTVFTGALVILLYFGVRASLPFIATGPKVAIAIDLLPYVLGALWINSNSAVFFAALEGMQEFAIASRLQIIGSIMLIASAMLLVPHFGLVGVVVAQSIQAVTQLLAAWIFIRRHVDHMPVFPKHWSSVAFKEMLGYGAALQLNATVSLFYEPMTKVLLARFGGLSSVAFFEMASRLVVQVRTGLISGVRTLVPYVATLHETEPMGIKGIYQSSYKVILYITLPIFALTFSLVPAVSDIWLGRTSPEFVFITRAIIAGWGVSTLSAACYYSYLGSGRTMWTTISHVSIGILNCVLSYAGGKLWGGSGVVIGWVLSLIIGSAIVIIAYHHEHEIEFKALWPKDTTLVIAASVLGATTVLLIYQPLRESIRAPFVGLMSCAVFLAFVVYPMWIHPARTSLVRAVRSSLSRG